MKDLTRVYQEINNNMESHIKTVTQLTKSLKVAAEMGDVDKVMQFKQDIMQEMIDAMPIGTRSCPYCAQYMPGCEDCPYMEQHDKCGNPTSDYARLLEALGVVSRHILTYYP